MQRNTDYICNVPGTRKYVKIWREHTVQKRFAKHEKIKGVVDADLLKHRQHLMDWQRNYITDVYTLFTYYILTFLTTYMLIKLHVNVTSQHKISPFSSIICHC